MKVGDLVFHQSMGQYGILLKVSNIPIFKDDRLASVLFRGYSKGFEVTLSSLKKMDD